MNFLSILGCMIMVVIYWLYLAVFLVSKVGLFGSSQWVMITRTSQRENLLFFLGIWERVPTTPLTYHRSLLKQHCLMKLLVLQTRKLTKSPCFYIFSVCGVSLSGMVSLWERGSQFMIKLPVFKKKCSCLFKNFLSD